MKSILKKVFITTVLSSFVLMSFGQIILDCDGNIGLGSSIASGYDITQAKTRFNSDIYVFSYYAGLIIDNSAYYAKALYSTSNNMGTIGKSDKAFNSVYSYNYPTLSDARRKENINPLSNSLSLILKLQGVSYDLKREFVINDSLDMNEAMVNRLDEERKNRIGFLAQDVNEILPEVVFYDDSTDIYMIDYNRFSPVLVEAIKEQQLIIENLQHEILAIKESLTNDGLKSASLEEVESTDELKTNTLYQNSPNPFNENTKIEFYLTEETQNAILNVYDMNGKQLRSIGINQIGFGNVTLSSMEYNAGMYMYALIADGIIVDTKQMILTD